MMNAQRAGFKGGWFHSGDLATIDDEGYITVVDRKKVYDQDGRRERREVEEAIYRMSGVSEVAVIGVPHPRWIEAIVAVIVVKAGMSLSKEAVLMHCGQHLAAFKVPKE
jgi:fatty-acyl-CoA synthase